ncbi:xre family transcriptional regulator [Lacticaseibacillus paracasei NRIC 1917]|uniref:Xre family transcriptional regulator n=2 Tax=Lacticaseibacillus paracasei TaxID=1597 RepID=A0A0C9QEW4_LACPA|nr:xre family transcriptional regulator [Lacticaseibacillus paracasei NRIC 0644]GAN40340.1 xre family transcriptional regulator [Lacticaseibacillus paracasei NRIC 1917]
MTQVNLAEQLHVSRHTVSNWENDRNLPDLEMVTRIAQIFEVSLDTLILDDPKLNEKLIHDSKISRHQMIMAVMTTAVTMMSGMAATTLFGFFPQWLAQLIWWSYVAVLFLFSYMLSPKSVGIFADWSVLSRSLIAGGFSVFGLIFLLIGIVLIAVQGVDLQVLLITLSGLVTILMTKPVWPRHQHAR